MDEQNPTREGGACAAEFVLDGGERTALRDTTLREVASDIKVYLSAKIDCRGRTYCRTRVYVCRCPRVYQGARIIRQAAMGRGAERLARTVRRSRQTGKRRNRQQTSRQTDRSSLGVAEGWPAEYRVSGKLLGR